ncbi:MAG: BrnT family toxin [Treponema sp.]|nr:BrnT family toxin [Treponema sp.]
MFHFLDSTFTWEEEKNQLNLEKHGLSFQEAVPVFLDPYFVVVYDEAHSSIEETRWKGIGALGDTILLSTIFSEVSETELKLISARKATKKEKEDYIENIRQIFGS